MTTEEKIALVRIFLNDYEIQDVVITSYLDQAEDRIISAEYPFAETHDDNGNLLKEMSKKYERTQCELASRMISRIGFLGQNNSNENGIIRTWESTDDIDILNRITPKVGVR